MAQRGLPHPIQHAQRQVVRFRAAPGLRAAHGLPRITRDKQAFAQIRFRAQQIQIEIRFEFGIKAFSVRGDAVGIGVDQAPGRAQVEIIHAAKQRVRLQPHAGFEHGDPIAAQGLHRAVHAGGEGFARRQFNPAQHFDLVEARVGTGRGRHHAEPPIRIHLPAQAIQGIRQPRFLARPQRQ